MIRVFAVDDHPALRTGICMLIQSEPGLVWEGSASTAEQALERIQQLRPDVVLIDYQLPDDDGLALCYGLKSLAQSPRVLVYSAYSDPVLAIPAILAGADGIKNKTALADELVEAIRTVARGRSVMPHPSPGLLETSVPKLDANDVPIFTMMMERTPKAEIAKTLSITESRLEVRIRVILARLRVETAQVEPGW